MSLVPEGVEPVVGWRTWTLTSEGLVSLSQRLWEPGRPLHARCSRESSGPIRPGTWVWHAPLAVAWWDEIAWMGRRVGDPPAATQRRILGYKRLSIAERDSYLDRLADETRVVGSVFLWGRIVRGEGLYRAEFAYPRELYVTPRLGRRRRLRRPAALRAYGVPIRVVPSYAELRTRSPYLLERTGASVRSSSASTLTER